MRRAQWSLPALLCLLLLLTGCRVGGSPAAGGTQAASVQAMTAGTDAPGASQSATPPPTPSLIPTATSTPVPTPTATPTPSPTPVPGESLVAFETYRDGNGEIYLLDTETGELSNLSRHDADDRAPAWRPDGGAIAFQSNRDGNWEIYVLDLADGSLLRLTEDPAYDGAPAWSPSGSRIAFESYRDNNLEIYAVEATGGEPRRLTDDPAGDMGPAWSPDGEWIAFTSWRDGNKEIYRIAEAGGEALNLTHNPADDEDPAWLPDGSGIAFVTWRDVDVKTGNRNAEIYRLKLADGAVERLTDNPWPDLEPAWDAHGRLVWVAYDPGAPFETYDPYRPGDYHLYREGSQGPERLTDSDADDRQPAPAPATVVAGDPSWSQSPTALVNPSPSPAMGIGTLAQVVEVPSILVSYGEQPILVNELVAPSLVALQEDLLKASGWDLLHVTLGSWRNLEQIRKKKMYKFDYGYLSWHKAGRALDLPLEYKTGGVDQMLQVREDLNGNTFWRLYVRAAKQDGSQGEPLKDNPWLYWWHIVPKEEPEAYDAGGKRLPIPAGYYVDVTALAKRHGWERIASYAIDGDYHWSTDSNGTEYWHYERTDGLDWWAAMLQIYEPEELDEHVGWLAGLEHAQSEAMMRSKAVPTPAP